MNSGGRKSEREGGRKGYMEMNGKHERVRE